MISRGSPQNGSYLDKLVVAKTYRYCRIRHLIELTGSMSQCSSQARLWFCFEHLPLVNYLLVVLCPRLKVRFAPNSGLAALQQKAIGRGAAGRSICFGGSRVIATAIPVTSM